MDVTKLFEIGHLYKIVEFTHEIQNQAGLSPKKKALLMLTLKLLQVSWVTNCTDLQDKRSYAARDM